MVPILAGWPKGEGRVDALESAGPMEQLAGMAVIPIIIPAPSKPAAAIARRASEWARLSRTPWRELRRMQDALVRRLVVERVHPFSAHYRRVMREARVDPRSIKGVDDLRRLPFTTKHDLLQAASDERTRRDFVLQPTPELVKQHWPLGRKLALLSKEAKEELRREYTPNFVTFTTGRSSEPVAFAYTPHDIDALHKVGGRMLDVHDIADPAARIVNLFPFAPHLAFWQASFAGLETGRFVLSTGGGKVMGTSGNIRLVERIQPQALIGTPGFLYHLLRQAREEGKRFSKVERVILGAEKVPPGLKKKIAEVLAEMGSDRAVVSGTYGFTEARMAFSECPTGHEHSSGYHTYPDLCVFEVVDPETGEPVQEGAKGELVYTPLDGRGTTVLRYRTGDLAIGGVSTEPCPWCGRTVPRIHSDLRRVSDQRALELTKIRGTLVDLSAMGAILSGIAEVVEWQVAIAKLRDDPLELDVFTVRVSLKPGADATLAKEKIRRELHDALEVTPNAVEVLDDARMLELLGMETELKEKRFLDLRPKA